MTGSVLAFDLGTEFGVAIWRPTGKITALSFGLGNLGSYADEDEREAQRAMRFARKVQDLLIMEQPEHVYFERVSYNSNAKDIHAVLTLWGYVVGLRTVCKGRGITPRTIAVSTARKAFTGNGRADKDEVQAHCRYLDLPFRNQHEADAICLLVAAIGQLRLPVPEPKSALIKRSEAA